VAMSPYGLAGPAGVPPAIVQVLHEAFKAAMQDPAFVAELARYDQEPAYLGPDDYGRALRTAYENERQVVDRLGLAHRTE
jgi:tripartite-type tricarboxylate transporter receptor subunit TctC